MLQAPSLEHLVQIMTHHQRTTAGSVLAHLDIAAAASALSTNSTTVTPPTQPLLCAVYCRPHNEAFVALAPAQSGTKCCMLVAATARHVLVMDGKSPHHPQLIWQHALGNTGPRAGLHLQLQARWTVATAQCPLQGPSSASGAPGTQPASLLDSSQAPPALGPAWKSAQPAPHRPVTQLDAYLSDGVDGTVVALRAWSQPAGHRLATGDATRWLQVLPLDGPTTSRSTGWAWTPYCMTDWGVVTAGMVAGLPLRCLLDHSAGSRAVLGPAALRWCASSSLDNQVRVGGHDATQTPHTNNKNTPVSLGVCGAG